MGSQVKSISGCWKQALEECLVILENSSYLACCAQASSHFCNFSVRTAVCLIRRDDLCMLALTYQHVCCMQSVNWSGKLVSYLLTVLSQKNRKYQRVVFTSCDYAACKHDFLCSHSCISARVSAEFSLSEPLFTSQLLGWMSFLLFMQCCCLKHQCNSCYLQYLMLCECQMCFLWFVDEKTSVFFTFPHRMKQRQNLGRTRFCLRAHGYVTDPNYILLLSLFMCDHLRLPSPPSAL